MKRHINFRAWEPKDKAWLDKFLLSNDGYVITPNGDNVTLQQSAGLGDCEGKEVFEGDIVKDRYGEIAVVAFYTNQYDGPEGGYGCTLSFVLDYGNKSLGSITKTEKVLGNIFENPDLLKPDTTYIHQQ